MLLIIKENVITWYECTVEAKSQEGTMNPFIIIKQICPKKIEKLYTFNWPYMTNKANTITVYPYPSAWGLNPSTRWGC